MYSMHLFREFTVKLLLLLLHVCMHACVCMRMYVCMHVYRFFYRDTLGNYCNMFII